MRLHVLVSVASIPCLLTSCDLSLLGSRDARCDLRPAKDQCTDLREFKGPSFLTFEGVCATLRAAEQGGNFQEDARCDMTGVVGGCQVENGDGSLQTNWYYKGSRYTSEADVTGECSGGQKFAPPAP